MERKKRFFDYLCVVLMMLPMAFFSACSDSDDGDGHENVTDDTEMPVSGEGGLSGYYRSEVSKFKDSDKYPNNCRVLYFKDKGTVVDYTFVVDIPNTTWLGSYGKTAPLPDHPGWYYMTDYNTYYTYAIVDNKLYITDGSIWTILDDGSRIVPDGGKPFTRW